MKYTYKFLLTLFMLLILQHAKGQLVKFGGLGRAIVTNDNIEGSILNNPADTITKGTGGYALFDLNIKVQPSDEFRASAILRSKNKFGVFGGPGTSLEFRQILLEGFIAQRIAYAIGDIDILQTPYTVFNNDEGSFSEYESDLFKMRRDIVHYENFNNGNHWRMQGMKSNATLLFDKGIDKMKVGVFATRSRASVMSTVPDRFLLGGTINMIHHKNGDVGFHYSKFYDVGGIDSQSRYKNDVVTNTFSIGPKLKTLCVRLDGEAGLSSSSLRIQSQDTKYKHGQFIDAGLKLNDTKSLFTIRASYKYVSPQYYSPSAQSQRIDVLQSPKTFSYRQSMLFDRFTEEGIYNQGTASVLQPYLPQYGVAEPYGAATPNRRGGSIKATTIVADSILRTTIGAILLSEIKGEGTDDKNSFFVIYGGTSFNISKLLSVKRNLLITGDYKHERSDRVGLLPTNFVNNMFNVGMNCEIIKNLDFIIGYKMLSSAGTTMIANYTNLNDISNYTPYNVNNKQHIGAVGARYRFSDETYFGLDYWFVNNTETELSDSDYRMNQFFINCTMKF
jgi:hypothetical protein